MPPTFCNPSAGLRENSQRFASRNHCRVQFNTTHFIRCVFLWKGNKKNHFIQRSGWNDSQHILHTAVCRPHSKRLQSSRGYDPAFKLRLYQGNSEHWTQTYPPRSRKNRRRENFCSLCSSARQWKAVHQNMGLCQKKREMACRRHLDFRHEQNKRQPV